jgi:hypothetical protein
MRRVHEPCANGWLDDVPMVPANRRRWRARPIPRQPGVPPTSSTTTSHSKLFGRPGRRGLPGCAPEQPASSGVPSTEVLHRIESSDKLSAIRAACYRFEGCAATIWTRLRRSIPPRHIMSDDTNNHKRRSTYQRFRDGRPFPRPFPGTSCPAIYCGTGTHPTVRPSRSSSGDGHLLPRHDQRLIGSSSASL